MVFPFSSPIVVNSGAFLRCPSCPGGYIDGTKLAPGIPKDPWLGVDTNTGLLSECWVRGQHSINLWVGLVEEAFGLQQQTPDWPVTDLCL